MEPVALRQSPAFRQQSPAAAAWVFPTVHATDAASVLFQTWEDAAYREYGPATRQAQGDIASARYAACRSSGTGATSHK